MTTGTPTYRPLLDIIVELAGHPDKPKSHKYGMKSVHADFSSSRGYVWPFPGGVAKSPKPPTPGGPCPAFEGDGLCVGLTAYGLSRGGHRLSTLLLVSYGRVYGADGEKVRVGSARVLAVIDAEKAARDGHLHGADLRSAYLYGADLHSAHLHGADLHGADLRRAYLRSADLHSADLRSADLRSAHLHGADLRSAHLHGAYLSDAYLHGADLSDADLDDLKRRGAIL